MRILAVSDHVDPLLYDYWRPERWQGIDLIISCGDLRGDYLSYLVSRFDKPLYYVHGNHDVEYKQNPPEGGEHIGQRLVKFGGLRILGIDGAPWYNGEPYQYREWQMYLRTRLLYPKILAAGGVDIIVTHTPPRFCLMANTRLCPKPAGLGRQCRRLAQIQREDQAVAVGELPETTIAKRALTGPFPMCRDADDRAHRGFISFRNLIDRFHPRYFLHGHTHLNYSTAPREFKLGETIVVDTFSHYILEV